MNKHSKHSWSSNLEKIKHFLGLYKTNKSHKIYISLDQRILLCENLEVIQDYLNSIKEKVKILNYLQPIILLPDIQKLFNFTFSHDALEIKNKQEIIKTIKFFTSEIKRSGIFVFFKIDVNEIYQYETIIKRVLEFKEYELGDKKNYWVQKELNQVEKYDVSDFLKTQALNLNLSSQGENKFKSSLYFILNYFKSSFFIDGVAFTNLSEFVHKKHKSEIKDSLSEMDYLLSKNSLEMKLKFLLKEEIFNKKLFKEFKKMNVFIDIIYNYDQINNRIFKTVKELTRLSKKGVSTSINFLFNNFCNHNQITSFLTIEYYTFWLSMLFLINHSIFIRYFSNFDKQETYFKTFLKNNFNFDNDVVTKNLDIETYLLAYLNKIHKFYYQNQIPISEIRKIKPVKINKDLFLLKIKLEEKTLLAYCNYSKNNYLLRINQNKLVFNSKNEILDNSITPYQILIVEK